MLTAGMGSHSPGLGTLTAGIGVVWPGFQGGSSGPVIPAATPSLWYGPNWEMQQNPLGATYSYMCGVVNNSGKTWNTIAPLFTAINATSGTVIGWRVRNALNSTNWTNGTFSSGASASWTPPVGTWSSDNRLPNLADPATLINPVLNGGTLIIDVVLSTGNHGAGLLSNLSYPNTVPSISRRSNAGQNVIAGDTPTWNAGFAQPWSHLYIGTDPAQGGIRKAGVGGDSLTAQVRPIADSNNTRREGYAYQANILARDALVNLNMVSFGQGTATLDQMRQHQQALAPILQDRLDWFFAQGVSFNSTPFDDAGEIAAQVDTAAARAAWATYGVRTGSIFMGPPGSLRNTGGTLAAYNDLRSYYTGLDGDAFVDLGPSVWDAGDNTIFAAAKSVDQVHVNGSASVDHGTLFYTKVRDLLLAQGEL